MRSSKIWLILVLAMLSLLAGCNPHEMVVSLTRDELQARIAPRFPLSKNWLVVNVVLHDPEIFLPEGSNQVGIHTLVDINVPFLKPISGQLRATAVPRYDPESKAFYLEQAMVEQLDLPGLSPELAAKARTAIETLAQQELPKHPIYELKGRNLKEMTAAVTLRDVQVRDGKLQATFALPL